LKLLSWQDLLSSTTEARRALFQEGGEALFHVLRRGEQPEVVGLEQQALVEGHLSALVHRLEREAYGKRPHAEDAPQRLFRGREKLTGRHNACDQADAMRLARVDHLAGQNEVQCVALAHESRQSLRTAIPRSYAELHLGLSELGVLARDAYVTRHRELAAAPERVAVHGRDHGFATRLEPPEHRLAAQGTGFAIERTLLRGVAAVGPRDERLLARAGE